jgi:hypothetical protein
MEKSAGSSVAEPVEERKQKLRQRSDEEEGRRFGRGGTRP